MDILARCYSAVRGRGLKVVLPEGEDARVLQAARRVLDEGLGRPMLLGQPEAMAARAGEIGCQLGGLELMRPEDAAAACGLAAWLSARREKLTPAMAARLLRKPLYCAGALVASIGHGVREVVEAQARQAGVVAYVHGTHFGVPAQEELAARLAAMAPGDLDRVYPVSGGSEANESAIKFARQVHLERGERERFMAIGREVSYHGNTLGALTVSGHAARRRPYRPLLREMPRGS